MPDQSWGSTAGVATQAAEVFHSASVGNRTSLAYMSPRTYMTHRMLQVAHTNLRKLARLNAQNPMAEMDHIRLNNFFHTRGSRRCERGEGCQCPSNTSDAKLASFLTVTSCSSAKVGVGRQRGEGATDDGAAIADDHASAGVGPVDEALHPGPVATGASPVGPDESAEHPQVGAEDSRHGGAVAAVTSEVGSSRLSDCSSASSGGASDDFRAAGAVDQSSGLVYDGHSSEDGAASISVAPAKGARQGNRRFLDEASVLFRTGLAAAPLSEYQVVFLTELVDGRAGDHPGQPMKKSGICLTVAAYNLLGGDHWLNDEIMHSYGGIIKARDDQLRPFLGREPPKTMVPEPDASKRRPRRTRVINTHFYDLLNRPRWG